MFDLIRKLMLVGSFILIPDLLTAAEKKTPAVEPQKPFRDCSACPEMIVIPKGEFLMGASPEEMTSELAAMGFVSRWMAESSFSEALPRHQVTIRQSFALGKYDVTRANFAAFINESHYSPIRGCVLRFGNKLSMAAYASWLNPGFSQTDRDPVVCVSWRDAEAYISWLNTKIKMYANQTASYYRLPTESEWEYASRGGRQTSRWWGDKVGINNANCDDCGNVLTRDGTSPVGTFPPNPFGLYDVLGNVWQWTADCWHKNYGGAPADGTSWNEPDCTKRVMRGGSWVSDPWSIRSAIRSGSVVDKPASYVGFRVAKSL